VVEEGEVFIAGAAADQREKTLGRGGQGEGRRERFQVSTKSNRQVVSAKQISEARSAAAPTVVRKPGRYEKETLEEPDPSESIQKSLLTPPRVL